MNAPGFWKLAVLGRVISALEAALRVAEPASIPPAAPRDPLRVDRAPTPWNQFRGSNGQGLAPEAELPVHIGPETDRLWEVAVPLGQASPAVWNGQIFRMATDPEDSTRLTTLTVKRERVMGSGGRQCQQRTGINSTRTTTRPCGRPVDGRWLLFVPFRLSQSRY